MAHETHAPAAHGHHAEHGEHTHGHGNGHHGLVQHQFDDLAQQRESYALGMWLFLATEVMMFGGLFFAYSLYRGMYPKAFEAGSSHLVILWGTINTFVLLFSSYTMARAVHAAQERNKRGILIFLGLTFILGAAFIGIKAIEWGTDWNEGLIPGLKWTYYEHHTSELQQLVADGIGPHQVLMYFTVYFCMTGLHAIHMIIGLALVAYYMWLTTRGFFVNGNDQPVEILGLYWHLVDIIWIFLFPLLYLIPGFNPFGGGPAGGGGGH